ncbi:UNVERIFIED_CONTAM: hypothetical protein Sangu_1855800 [Sesamum angustifolium]|uniref:Aminotransferase-like plant mobile domain-containing protein n=1 Tax=Sesamum angustifolium TaxID=2727405 RepID=A0AAW2M9N3_9LAMI
MSISLWDLHELVGLPMTGCLNDEVVPSAVELTRVDEKKERFIPRSWKKTVGPKSTHNPLGDIAIHERWSTVEEALFAKLCIERSLKEEVYLAAYLTCWLCLFVLPDKDVNSIRPRGFEDRCNFSKTSRYESLFSYPLCLCMASMLLQNSLLGLARVAWSKDDEIFWRRRCKYYEPREARKRIHKAEFVSWACNMLMKDEPFKFVDDGRAEELDHSYLLQFVRVILLFVKAADSSLSHIVHIDLGVNLGTIKMYQEPSDMTHVWPL